MSLIAIGFTAFIAGMLAPRVRRTGLVFGLVEIGEELCRLCSRRTGVTDEEAKALLACPGHELDEEEQVIVARLRSGV